MDSQPRHQFKNQQKKIFPQYIPQEVLTQLHNHLSLPVQISRMVILLQECGIHLTELCSVSFDCLDQDAEGNWFLRYKRLEMKEQCIIPVSNKAAAIIIEQQVLLFTKLRKVPHFLFSNRKGQAFSQQSFLKLSIVWLINAIFKTLLALSGDFRRVNFMIYSSSTWIR